MKTYIIPETAGCCDACSAEFETLETMTLDPIRGCLCSECATAFIRQELMESGVISWQHHATLCMEEE